MKKLSFFDVDFPLILATAADDGQQQREKLCHVFIFISAER